MDNQQQSQVLNVLNAALHNAKVVKDQLESLVNKKDKSFKDYPMTEAVKQVDEAIDSIQKAVDTLNG